jgi:hypothetical protein
MIFLIFFSREICYDVLLRFFWRPQQLVWFFNQFRFVQSFKLSQNNWFNIDLSNHFFDYSFLMENCMIQKIYFGNFLLLVAAKMSFELNQSGKKISKPQSVSL